MKDSIFIEKLEPDNFYFNGSVYLHKIIKNKNERNSVRNLGKTPNAATLMTETAMEFNFFDELSKSDSGSYNYFKSKMQDKVLAYTDEETKDTDNADYDIGELAKLKAEMLETDVLVLLPKTNLGTKVTCDPAISSLYCINAKRKNLYLGFVISRTLAVLIFDAEGVDSDSK